MEPYQFLGAFAKSLKATISFIMSSGSPHGASRLQLDGFSWNFIFEYFSKLYREKDFIKIRQARRVLYMKTNIQCTFLISPAQFFLE